MKKFYDRHYSSKEEARAEVPVADSLRLAALYGLTLTELYPVGRMFSLKKLAPGLLCGELSFVFRRDR